MDNIELENYSDADLLSLLKSKENEVSMIKETYEEAKKSSNSQEGGLIFLNKQIIELMDDISQIKTQIVKNEDNKEDKKKKPYVKPEISYMSSNAVMADLINKINECAIDDTEDDMKPQKSIPVKTRQNRYKVATNNNFTVSFTSLNDVDPSQIKTINFALAGDKQIIVEFFDYNYRTPQNGTICLEKVILDAKSWGTATDITISTFDKEGLEMKREIFTNCKITDIYTRGMYDYSDEEVRTISAVFTYEKFNVYVPLVDYEAVSEKE